MQKPELDLSIQIQTSKTKKNQTKIILEDRENGRKMMGVHPNIIKIWY